MFRNSDLSKLVLRSQCRVGSIPGAPRGPQGACSKTLGAPEALPEDLIKNIWGSGGSLWGPLVAAEGLAAIFKLKKNIGFILSLRSRQGSHKESKMGDLDASQA